jgi:Domain of unknown function (DUF4365)
MSGEPAALTRTRMSAQQHQGRYGESFIYALGTAAGLVVSAPSLDVEGVDWQISFPGATGQARYPAIAIQVKTWRQRPPSPWSLRLKAKHFNELAGPGFLLRRYLVAVAVPQHRERYASCEATGMTLRHAAYWMSFVDEEQLPADVTSTTVAVPQQNLLTHETLLALVIGS